MTKKKSFEQAVKRLNAIVDELETGDTELDDMLKLYEEGTELIKFCFSKLDDVEKKISHLSGDTLNDISEQGTE